MICFFFYCSVRSGQIKNSESARVSMIGQVKPCSASPDPVGATDGATVTSPSDTIMEEEEQSTDISHHTEQVCVLTLAA